MLPPFGRDTTRDGDQMGLGFPVELARLPRAGPLLQGPQVLFDKAAARALNGGYAARQSLGNLVIGQSLIRFQQAARPCHFAGSGFTAPDHGQ